MNKRTTAAILATAGLSVAAALAQAEPVATTQQSSKAEAKVLRYATEAGYIPVASEASNVAHARMFYTAYLARTPASGRPIAFVWNGGPGSPASWVQFRAFGPRLIGESAISDNPDTLLPAADLVFIDPIGTGFSRATKPEYAKEYYNTLGDAAATTDMIQKWLRAHHAEGRPVFLIGESFGGYRAGGVAERLESAGQHLAGVILVSGGVASGPLIPPHVRAALVTPQRTATALALGKLSPSLGSDRAGVVRTATQWSLETYLPALARIATLSDEERESIARDLSLYTGFPAAQIDRKTLQIRMGDYLKVMSPTPDQPLTTFDMRTTRQTSFSEALIHRYYDDLGVKSQPPYWGPGLSEDPGRATGEAWVYNYRWPESERYGKDYAEPWLPRAMKINPKLQVFVAAGQYDALNSCAENGVLLGLLDTELARNYAMNCYLGGHMMYNQADTRKALNSDLKVFIRRAATR